MKGGGIFINTALTSSHTFGEYGWETHSVYRRLLLPARLLSLFLFPLWNKHFLEVFMCGENIFSSNKGIWTIVFYAWWIGGGRETVLSFLPLLFLWVSYQVKYRWFLRRIYNVHFQSMEILLEITLFCISLDRFNPIPYPFFEIQFQSLFCCCLQTSYLHNALLKICCTLCVKNCKNISTAKQNT